MSLLGRSFGSSAFRSVEGWETLEEMQFQGQKNDIYA